MTTAIGTDQFGVLLRDHRRRSGMTQQQMADLATLSVRAIRDLESGRARRPRQETARLLADVLRLTGASRDAFHEAARSHLPSEGPGAAGPETCPPPALLGTTVGREHEIHSLVELLTVDQQRLVSVVGLGGVGKTRIVREAAGVLREGHGWTVIWVQAAGLSPELRELRRLEPAVTGAGRGRGHDVLLVLDGLAHRVEGSLIHHLLARGPGLRVVVTAPTPSRLAGEQVMPIAPLPVPGRALDHDAAALAEFPSVRLFLSHLRRLRPYAPRPAATAAVAELCRVLDGVPGALETTAAWGLVHAPEELLHSLTRDPERFSSPPAPWGPASGSGCGAVAGSLAALEPPLRERLFALSALPGSWTLDEAAPLAGTSLADTAATVYGLLIHGLVRTADEDGRDRFKVLHRVRSVLAGRTAPLPDGHALPTGYAIPAGYASAAPTVCAVA
ncbi:XRE family transcriptional regulator [Streptomyces gardneri]|uniref:helix-turn-helix domain-containing protein n=1 Tax=Streptomyces gardneri TaxID=66892 RepID=UPI0006BD6069|nr:helix-turn-helix domain-containing protein [Streptomyces gardneri]QPK49492.1 XRE family transcriptional regulator [Streptomyces gardneri]WRK41033.1 helix-turn-helix domain-containing protein [Streptomyces venezuelae]CUM36573.1 putative transcriptional regulator [Streptomyces venezuelae]